MFAPPTRRRTALRSAACGLAVALALTACDGPPPVLASAKIRVTDEVVHAAPPRLGVNIGESTYYNDQQVVANPFAHGGFRKGRQTLLIEVRNGTANTVEDARFAAEDPDRSYAGSFAGGRYCVMTGARAGETGAVVAHEAGSPAFTLEHGGAPIAGGEYVMLRGPWVSRALPLPAEGEPLAGIGDFRAMTDDGVALGFVDNPADPRDQALRVQFPGGAMLAGGVRHYIKATPDTAYRVRLRARADFAGARLSVGLRNFGIPHDAPGSGIRMTPDRDALLGTEWQEFVFSGATTGDRRIDAELSVFEIVVDDEAGVDGAAYLDEIALEDGALATPSGFNRYLVEALAEARCGSLRFYGIADLGATVDDMTARDTTAATWSFLSLRSFARHNHVHATVDQWLQLAETAGAAPWLTIGSANMPEDWYNLISYLCAPADFDEYSRRRAAHGFAQPWVGKFDKIRLEIGNEWWNAIFAPFHVWPPEKHAELCNTIVRRAREHPHFDAERIEIVAGGWAINAHHWNGIVDRASAGHDALSIAPYALHELDRYDTPEDRYAALFAAVDGFLREGAASTRADLAENGRGTRLAVYELNTHLTGGAAPAKVASDMCTSVAAGVAVLDMAMAAMRDLRAAPINYFTALQRGYDDRLGLWGVFVRAEDGPLRPRPVWHGLRLANRFLIEGDMVAAEVSESPTWDQPENGNVPAMDGLPYLRAYAFRCTRASGARGINLLAINRHRTQTLRADVTLPFPQARRVTRTVLAADRISANNESGDRVQLRAEELDMAADTPVVTVPPFAAVVYRFDEAR